MAARAAGGRGSRRVWPWLAGGLVALVGGGVVGVETLGRDYATQLVADQVSAGLGLPASTPVRADLGEGSLVLQLLSGRIDRVAVSADDVALGPLSGTLSLVASDVPLDMTAATSALDVEYALGQDAIARVSDQLTGIPIDAVSFAEPEITVTGTAKLWAFELPLGLGLTPGAENGDITFTASSIRIGDATFDAAALRADPLWGGLASTILRQGSICIADQIPAALSISAVEVRGEQLVVRLDGSKIALGGDGLTTKGTCA